MKCKIMHMGLRSIKAKYTVDGVELGESDLGKDMDILVEKKIEY